MPFVESAETLRAKLHMTDAKTSSLAGICIAVVIVIALLVQGVFGIVSGGAFEVVKADEQAGESEAGAAGEEAGEKENAEALDLYVHVAGAVEQPGMYALPEGSRVQDAIDAAGGYADDAAESSLNLARPVSDGEKIQVPTAEEVQDADAAASANGGAGAKAGNASLSDGSVIGGKVNINAADASKLDELPGIGKATAEKIVADREANGPFATAADIQRVSGIGAKKYEQLEDLICVG